MGMCCIQYQVCSDDNSFTLSAGAIAAGTANPAKLDTDCKLDYTEIIGNVLFIQFDEAEKMVFAKPL
jgi:hypothetical protein